MARMLYLVFGILIVILGVWCIDVERVVVKRHPPAAVSLADPRPAPDSVIVLSPLTAWTLIGGGGLICLHSFLVAGGFSKPS